MLGYALPYLQWPKISTPAVVDLWFWQEIVMFWA